MDLWFSEQAAGFVGAAVGVIYGAGFGGLGGGIGGPLAAMGKARTLVVGMFAAGFVFGVALAATGLVALVLGQPWYVWFVFLLPGVIGSLLFGMLTPIIRARYTEAEQRKLEAAAIRGA